MELPHSENENQEQGPERDPRLEQLTILAAELDFVESDTLNELHLAAVQALQTDKEAGIEAMTAFQIAAAAHVQTTPRTSNSPIGYRVMVAKIWFEGGEIDLGLDELWDTAYQAGQTPGIKTLRETLEDFVSTF